jgi:hypothetical protein
LQILLERLTAAAVEFAATPLEYSGMHAQAAPTLLQVFFLYSKILLLSKIGAKLLQLEARGLKVPLSSTNLDMISER